MITLEEAKNREQALYDQGTRWLEDSQVLDMLKPLGDVLVEGSYIYRLMVKPDIDVHIFNPQPDFDLVREISKKFLDMPELVRIRVLNTIKNTPKAGEPNGYYIGVKVEFEGTLWTLDVWVTKPENQLDSEFFKRDWYTHLTPEQHNTILLLKFQLKEAGRYGGTTDGRFASADVYRAVILDNITSLDKLDEWRVTHPYR